MPFFRINTLIGSDIFDTYIQFFCDKTFVNSNNPNICDFHVKAKNNYND